MYIIFKIWFDIFFLLVVKFDILIFIMITDLLPYIYLIYPLPLSNA